MTLLKRTIFCLLSSCICFTGICQEIRLSIYEGVTLAKRVDNYHYAVEHYEGEILGDWRLGIGVACFLENAYDLELLYYHQDTKVPTTFYSPNGTLDHEFDMTIQWIVTGFTAFISKKSVKPFLGTNIGMGILTLKDPASGYRSSRTKFTWGGNLGMEFSIGKLIALRLKGDLLYSVKLNYPSPGIPSASVDIAAYNFYLHTGISAGIVFRFKLHKKK